MQETARVATSHCEQAPQSQSAQSAGAGPGGQGPITAGGGGEGRAFSEGPEGALPSSGGVTGSSVPLWVPGSQGRLPLPLKVYHIAIWMQGNLNMLRDLIFLSCIG